MNKETKINPKVYSFTVGIKELRTITVYPLSVASQLNLTDIVTKSMQLYFSTIEQEKNDFLLVKGIMDIIREGIEQLIPIVTCGEEDGKKLLEECTNDQFLPIVQAIFEVNYEGVIKNGKSLWEKMKDTFQSQRQLPSSVDTTQDTE